MRRIQAALIVLAAGAMIAGIYRGELADIYRKAILVCLECIGIG